MGVAKNVTLLEEEILVQILNNIDEAHCDEVSFKMSTISEPTKSMALVNLEYLSKSSAGGFTN